MYLSGNIPALASYAISFINGVLVPLVFALAFAFFLFGVLKFYFLKPGDPASRKEGAGFIVGAVIAFAVMLSVWGLVNILVGSVPFGSLGQPYLPSTRNAAPSGSTFGSSPVLVPAPTNSGGAPVETVYPGGPTIIQPSGGAPQEGAPVIMGPNGTFYQGSP